MNDLDKELRERNGKLFWYHYDKMKEAFQRGANLHAEFPSEVAHLYSVMGCMKWNSIEWEDFFKFVDEERELSERWRKK